MNSFVWCDDDRTEQFRAQRCEAHRRPAGLAVADHARLAWPARGSTTTKDRFSDGLGRDYPGERTVDRSIERAAFDDEFRVLVQHVRSGLRAVFSVLFTALAHHVEKQDRTLPGIERIGEASANDEMVG
ncbi:hypothetical protein JOH52_006177 [Sinorhizobium meliloti]|uniref:Uncharacterized protein n=1 Tax=Sinorhizobium meliloti (strain SM11) TaxID=707241 RepID=F7XAZ9_SINMM|nr:hypothetical protein SM11_pC1325 [Sinorhizobium meliloti SM11]MBP2470085.1 hypothetical protein [Sinorhizobium meliloti]